MISTSCEPGAMISSISAAFSRPLRVRRPVALRQIYWANRRCSTGIWRPGFLKYARRSGLTTVWEQHGPPDFCKHAEGKWT